MASVALYADGGVVARNPSTLGGTWAWCGVDESGWRRQERGGFVLARDIGPPLPPVVTNNQMEWLAVLEALEAQGEGWDGLLFTDSLLTINRLKYLLATLECSPSEVVVPRGLPLEWYVQMRGIIAYQRVELRHIRGHPNADEIRRRPQHSHQVWCDMECRRQATKVGLLLVNV